MLSFWIIAALLTAAALAFVIPPLLRQQQLNETVDRNHINIAIYNERIAELEQDKTLPEEEKTQIKQELEKNLAQDLSEASDKVSTARARWVSGVIILAVPAMAFSLYIYQIGDEKFFAGKMPVATAVAEENLPPVEDMVTELARRMQEDPSNLEGWYLLARSYAGLKRYPEAAAAYKSALAVGGDKNADILTDYAEVLAFTQKGSFAGEATGLLAKALTVNPANQKALWLSGFAAMQAQEYQQAVTHWEGLLIQIPETETEVIETLNKQIAQAQAKGGLEVTATPSTATVQKPVVEKAPDAASTARLTISVDLDESLKAKVNPDATLFVYARATSGAPMPLAIVRKVTRDLPLTVTLDDSMAMVPAMRLSSFPEVAVIARISEAGSATTQSGDLIGQLTPVVINDTPEVKVTINQLVP